MLLNLFFRPIIFPRIPIATHVVLTGLTPRDPPAVDHDPQFEKC